MNTPRNVTARAPLTIDELRHRTTLTVEEAGRLLGLNRGSAYQAASRGDLPTIRIGRRLLVGAPALLRLIGDDGPTPVEPVDVPRAAV